MGGVAWKIRAAMLLQVIAAALAGWLGTPYSVAVIYGGWRLWRAAAVHGR
jgi:hypothetical protein